jgi:lipoprotein-anchoring transpeptidase ErfK/SrfK
MRRVAQVIALTCPLLAAFCAPASAQGWPSWAERAFGDRSDFGSGSYRRWPDDRYPERDSFEERKSRPLGGDIRDGGPRPAIAPQAPPVVAFPHNFPANSILIDTGGRKLYYVLADSRAYEYSISVGREGFNWNGSETVSRKQAWPDWHPPAEMRERDPSLPEKMTGGVRNPLGAMALYLGTTLYRIHGTNDVKSIGRAESSGCFRILNASVLHLASVTEIGTPVNVVTSLPPPGQVSQVVPSPRSSAGAPPQPREPAVAPTSPPAAAANQSEPSVSAPNQRAFRDSASPATK